MAEGNHRALEKERRVLARVEGTQRRLAYYPAENVLIGPYTEAHVSVTITN